VLFFTVGVLYQTLAYTRLWRIVAKAHLYPLVSWMVYAFPS